MNNWISVEDKKPNEDEDVLLFIVYAQVIDGQCHHHDTIITGGIRDGDWYAGNNLIIWDRFYNLEVYDDDITHWMPLPAAPEIAGDKK